MQHNLVNRLASIPGVSEVSMLGGLPMTGFMSQDPIFASDHATQPTRFLRFAASSPRRPAPSTLLGPQCAPVASSPGPRSTKTGES